jgi:hypothetical protein
VFACGENWIHTAEYIEVIEIAKCVEIANIPEARVQGTVLRNGSLYAS